ncbi:MAG: hypothetical protein GOV00_02610 [Candidatus Altiarchaeota archaeon]|nr:hypothetical protein [Candidatus Altiarchaeota archaeon]
MIIQMAVVGDNLETAYFTAKRGFLVLGLTPKMDEFVIKANTTKFVLFGTSDTMDASIRLTFHNTVQAVAAMVDSADIIIITGGGHSDFVKSVAQLRRKPFIEGKGIDAVEKAAERVVRYNLFGKKKG